MEITPRLDRAYDPWITNPMVSVLSIPGGQEQQTKNTLYETCILANLEQTNLKKKPHKQ